MTGNDIAVLLSFLAAAVALAGFAGIVTSIDRGAEVASNEVISYRVRNLVLAAILSVALSMVPILVEALHLMPDGVWPLSCILSAIGQGWLLIHTIQGRSRMKAPGQDAGLSHSLFVASTAFAAVAFVVGLFGAAGMVAGRGAYFLGLFYLQCMMCAWFYRMIVVADEAARRTAPSTT